MKSYGWALIPYDWCLYEKRRLGPRNTQINYQARTQREDSSLRVKERGLRKNQTFEVNTSVLNLQPPEL